MCNKELKFLFSGLEFIWCFLSRLYWIQGRVLLQRVIINSWTWDFIYFLCLPIYVVDNTEIVVFSSDKIFPLLKNLLKFEENIFWSAVNLSVWCMYLLVMCVRYFYVLLYYTGESDESVYHHEHSWWCFTGARRVILCRAHFYFSSIWRTGKTL